MAGSLDAGTVEGALVLKDLATEVLKRVAESMSALDAKAAGTQRSVGGVGERFDALSKSATRLGQSLKGIGDKMTLGLTLPMAAAGAGALKLGMDFDKTMTQVVTLSGVAEDQMQSFRSTIEEMSADVGRGPNELAKGLLVVTSTGLRGAEAMDVLRTAAKASAVGLGETNDIARALTSAMNAYGKENLSAARAGDILLAAVREGGAEANEFAGTLGRVVGIASQVGVSFEEVTSFIATFTRLGVDASEATTSLRGVLTTLMAPTREAEQALANYGLSAAQLRTEIRDKGLMETLTRLIETFKGDATAAEAVFGNVRALAGVMANAGSQAKGYEEVLGNVKNSTDDLNKAYERMKDTPAQTWAQFKAQAELAAVTLGNRLAPAMQAVLNAAKPLFDWLVDMLNAFAKLPQPVQTSVLALLGIAALAGPLLRMGGNVLTLVGYIAKLGTSTAVVAGLEKAFLALSLTLAKIPGFTTLAAGVGGLVGKLTLATAAVYSLAGALAFLTGMALGKIWNSLEDGAAKAEQASRKAAENAMVLQWAIENGLKPNAKGVFDVAEAHRMFTAAAEKSTNAALNFSAASKPMASHATAAAGGMKLMASHGTEVEQATKSLSQQMREANAALDGATKAELANVRAGLAMGKTTEDIVTSLRQMPGGTKLTAAAIELYKERLAEAERQTKKTEKATEDLKEEYAETMKLISRVTNELPDGMTTVDHGLQAWLDAWKANSDAVRTYEEQNAVERTRIYRGELAARMLELQQYFTRQREAIDKAAPEAAKALAAIGVSEGNAIAKLLREWNDEEARKAAEKAGEDAAKSFIGGWKRFKKNIAAALTDSMIGALQGGGNVFAAMAGTLGNELMKAFQGSSGAGGKAMAGLGAGLVAGLQGASVTVERESKALGALAGAASGAAMGASVGGPIGAAVGGAIGLIGGLFGDAKKKSRELREELIKNAGGINELRKAAEWAGVSMDAFLNAKKAKDVQAAFDKIQAAIEATKKRLAELVADLQKLQDTGGLLGRDLLKRLVADKGKDEVKSAVDAFFRSQTALAVGGIDAWLQFRPATLDKLKEAQEAVKSLSQNEAELAAEVAELEKREHLTEDQKRQLEETRQKLAEIRGELAKAQSNVDKFGSALAALELNPQTASALQAGLGGLFGDLLAQGASPVQAIQQLAPSIQALQAQMAAAGLTGTAAFDELVRMAGLVSDEVAGPLLSAVAGLGQGLTGLHNTGLLTQEMFLGLARGAYDAFHALELQGKGGVDAARMMQPTLQRIWELQQDFGYEVDESTQKLLDFAASSGLIGENFRPAQDQMVKALDTLISRFDQLIAVFDRVLPRAAENGANQVNNALDRIDFADVAARGVDAFADIEDAATRAAWGSSPTGIKEIPIATQEAIDKLAEFGPYAMQVFGSIEEMAASYARTVAASSDKLGAMLVTLGQSWEDTISTPLQKTLNGIDRELMNTLSGLSAYKDDPRYQQAVELAQRIADIKGREAVFAERERQRSEAERASQSTGSGPAVEQIVVVHLDGHVLTEAHLKNFPDVAKVIAR